LVAPALFFTRTCASRAQILFVHETGVAQPALLADATLPLDAMLPPDATLPPEATFGPHAVKKNTLITTIARRIILFFMFLTSECLEFLMH
jgi:hypothetical protein